MLTSAPQQPATLDHEVMLRRIVYRIRTSLDLQVILDTTAQEIQQFLAIDRVMIYKFHPDQSGQVIAEHLAPQKPLPALQGLNFPADDIPQEARQLFIEARIRNIVDVEAGIIGQSRLRDPETGAPLAEDWVYRPLDPCHAEYLGTMGVKASVVSPIFHGEQLWGLLVAHHSSPLEMPIAQLDAIQLIVGQLSTAIAQADLLAQAQARGDREAQISHIFSLLHDFPIVKHDAALEATVKAVNGVGGRLFILPGADDTEPNSPMAIGEVYTYGQQPQNHSLGQDRPIELMHGVQSHLKQTNHAPWAIEDVFAVGSLRTVQLSFQQAELRSWLLVPLMAHGEVTAYLSIFRAERDTETLWAGQFEPDARQAFPRQSFEIWRQTQQGQLYPWSDADIDIVKTLMTQFAIAIERNALYQRITRLNDSLETQVKERTADLQKTLEELKDTQTKLIHTEKMSSLGQLVAGIAHEINNPVNFIHGNIAHIKNHAEDVMDLLSLYQQHFPDANAEILDKSEAIDLEFIAEDFPKILSSVALGTKRIREIIQSLRNFSRLDQAELKSVDVHEGIDSTLMILQHRLKQTSDSREIEVHKEYSNLPRVECFASQLNQVFMNILSNAIDALEGVSDRPRIIRICTEAGENEQVVIRISDNGYGMSEAVKNQLFDPFFTTKPVGKGTGLGLSISYDIVVNKHQGTLLCQSSMDEGTLFTITIPQQQTSRT